jgi:hypothetical protein
LHIKLLQPRPSRRQSIDLRRLDLATVESHIPPAQIVREEEYHMGPGSGGDRKDGRGTQGEGQGGQLDKAGTEQVHRGEKRKLANYAPFCTPASRPLKWARASALAYRKGTSKT